MNEDRAPESGLAGPDDGPPPRSPIPFLIYWFLIPLIVVLLLERFHVVDRVGTWLAGP
jgi:hypothetical protein